MQFLDAWNAQPAGDAANAVLPCCGSHAWANALVARRPLSTLPELLAASDAAWWSVAADDWSEAFNAHPRIGEQRASGETTATSLRWSQREQSALSATPDSSAVSPAAQLASANRAYESRFGRIFLIRAAGRTAAEILVECNRRLRNTPEAELQEAAEQQREITHLRLQRWLAEGEGTAA